MNKDEVIERARQTAIQENWTWQEPISAICRMKYLVAGRKIWYVRSNVKKRGCNVYVDIADDTGEILGKGFMPR